MIATISAPMKAREIVETDLEYMGRALSGEFSKLAGKRLLIIGGAGFLGYYLTQSVLHWNRRESAGNPIRLTVFDNFIRGVPDWLSALVSAPEFKLAKHDVTGPFPAGSPDFDFLIHAGSIASPVYYRKYPIETMDANVNGLRMLLEYCVKRKESARPVEGLLFFSSSEIYGDPLPADIPTPETCRGNVSCTGPRACYDESKRYGETLCVNFAAQFGLPIKVVRPFNNYGPGLKITDKRVLPDFVQDLLSGRDIVLRSDGRPKRTFCYVADAVTGYYKALVNGGAGEAYNIGVEDPEVSMGELAEKVAGLGRELFGYRGGVALKVDMEYLIDNPDRRCPVIAKAREHLGYAPSIGLDEGLRRSLLWYAGNPQAEES
jgi:nucleoside-diphosphate-sugar epimerase